MKKYKSKERRRYRRFEFFNPLTYRVCKRKTVSKLLEGYASNISEVGICCNIKEKIKKGDTLWLSFDRQILDFCKELEKKSFIYQKGIIGKVIWIKQKRNKTYDVGICFFTREEKERSFIYPLIHFYGLDYKEPEEKEVEEGI